MLMPAHDVVEIDAGDTYAYDADGLKTQKAREDAAKQRIYSLLPDDQKRGLMAVFDEFEADETAEGALCPRDGQSAAARCSAQQQRRQRLGRPRCDRKKRGSTAARAARRKGSAYLMS